MQHTKTQYHRRSGSGDVFLPYMGVAVMLDSVQNILNKFWLTYHKESSHEI